MQMKTLLPLAIIAILPFGARATDWVEHNRTYHYVDSPQKVPLYGTVNVAYLGPYQSTNITNDDAGHIATTAYVKGAYNDAIAAINSIDGTKQSQMIVIDTATDEEFNVTNVVDCFDQVDGPGFLINAEGVEREIDNKINSKRVEIYTTWDDNDTTEVSLITASD